MNQRLSLIINGILSIAVVILFYLQLKNKEQNESVQTAQNQQNWLNDSSSVQALMQSGKPLNVVFVRADSIYVKYEYFVNLKKGIEAKTRRSEAELEGEMKRLEKDYEDAQRRAQSMNKEQIAELEQRFMMRQQQLGQLRDRLAEELAVEEEKLNRQLRNKVQDYFNRIAAEKGIDYIVSYFPGSNVIWANDQLDITNEVLADLNREYRAGKK